LQKKNNIEAWLSGLGAPSADRDYKPGHERMHALLKNMVLKRPHLRIRIAGTNGKGSTACMLAAALQACGLKVGLYTSPHIHHFNERIRINGNVVSDETLLNIMPAIVGKAQEIGASYFEVATAMALRCFSDTGVDVEILEAGVGARLDATTAVAADLALLTPVALDHQVWLGETLTEIAAEKAHIFAGCRWRISIKQGNIVQQEIDKCYTDVQYVSPSFSKLPLRMNGGFQQQNAALALAAVELLQTEHNIGDIHVAQQAIAQTVVPGRLQKIQHGRQCFWLDAAHNLHAIQSLLPSLPTLADPFDVIFVFPRADRDLAPALPLLRPYARRLVGPPRYRDRCDATYACVEDALAAESFDAGGSRFLVLGSFTTVAAASRWLTECAKVA